MILLYWTTTLLLPMTKTMLTWHMLRRALLQWKEVSMMTAQMRKRGQMPKKMSAASSAVSKRTATYVSREREERDLPKISTFPSAPKSGKQRANRRPLSPIRPPSFTSGGSSRGGININHEKKNTKKQTKKTTKKVIWKHHLLKIINMAHSYITQWNCS